MNRAASAAVRRRVLATPVRRLQWAASHLVFAFGGSAVILVAAGAATGLTHGLRVGDVGGPGTGLAAIRRRDIG